MSPELEVKVKRLCEVLTNATHKKWKHSRGKTSFTYSVGQKYIRIISCEHGQHRSVWGFINRKEWTKSSGITFKEGDVLKSAGWKTPTLNAPRGNILEGYEIPPDSMRLYGPDYLR
jgi:hypothetical protein